MQFNLDLDPLDLVVVVVVLQEEDNTEYVALGKN